MDVPTDSDGWGSSATPWSLAAGHGLIRLDELHWHLSYLNDCVYLSLLSASPWPCSSIHPQFADHGARFTYTPSQDDTVLAVCAAPRDTGSSGGGQLTSRSNALFRSKWKYFYWRQTRGSGEWLTKAASRCQRGKHHINRNTPVVTSVTVKAGRWNESVWQPSRRKEELINDVSVVSAFCWRVWSVFKELPWQKDKQMLWDVWPFSWWRAVGILKSHFLVFKRHPSHVDSDFLSSLTATEHGIASQVLGMPSEVLPGAFRLPLWSASGQMAARHGHFWQLPPGRNTSRKWTVDSRGVIDRDFTRLNLRFRCQSGKKVCPSFQHFCWCLPYFDGGRELSKS